VTGLPHRAVIEPHEVRRLPAIRARERLVAVQEGRQMINQLIELALHR
jgi:hypothetical protein